MKPEENTLIIPLEGVEREHCARIINKALDGVEGILAHDVQINNKRALIRTDHPIESVIAVVSTIRSLGYDVDTVTKNYPVLNLSCASCASSSESILKSKPGVIAVNVNYANTTARIEYVPTIVSPQELKEALQSMGYDLAIDDSDDAKEALEKIKKNKSTSLKFKTYGAVLLSVPLVIIAMFFMHMPFANYMMWALATPVIVLFGNQFFIGAFKQLKHRSANMDTLVALSTGVAYLFSVFNTLSGNFSHRMGGHADVYFEASSVVIAFILLGKLLEEKAKGSASSAIKKLVGLQPATVTIIHEGGHQMEMPVARVKTGDILLVRPGDKIAVDGVVTNGSSYVDESMMSGEPVPVGKMEGKPVFAGTINQKGSFQLMAQKVGGDTVLAQIIKMVQDAQGSKAPVQKLVDKIAAVFLPVVICIAVFSLTMWCIFGGENGFSHGMLALVTVLVVACPCALGLATPTAIMVGVGKGAENGILIKDAESLEIARKINAVVLDKTGTLTEGKPTVTDIMWLAGVNTAEHVFASLEKQSGHPLAGAIVKHFSYNSFLQVDSFESISGFGAKGKVDNSVYYAGNLKLLEDNHISVDKQLKDAETKWVQQAKTVVFFADDKHALAVVAITDKIKETSVLAVKSLKEAGIEVHMVSGDNESTTKEIAFQAGITYFRAGVLPAGKAAYVKKLQSEGKVVAMVGDGINDSAALAQANISIAMGTGSDIAMDVAKMTIISSDLTRIPKAIRLSRYTVATIRQNLFWAFIYNVIGIPLAAGILYPVNGFLMSPMIAGAAMALSSVSVVTNSIRLKYKKI